MAYKYLLLEKEDGIGILYINRPEAMNALNTGVLEEIIQAADEISRDDEIQVLIITGAGDKSFVAGADIKEMHGLTAVEGREFGYTGQAAFRAIEKLEKPVIAAVNGFALGGGCELALACDIRIAADNAVFGLPEINLGIIPGGSGTLRLTRLVGEGKAKELIFLGEIFDAKKALDLGIINRLVALEDLEAETLKLARKLTRKPPVALHSAKELIHLSYDVDIHTGLMMEKEKFAYLFSTEDQREGMLAFLEGRKASFQGK